VKIDILSYRTLRAMWRYMIVINLVLGRAADHAGSHHANPDGRPALHVV